MATPTVPTAQPATPLNPFVVKLPEKLDFWPTRGVEAVVYSMGKVSRHLRFEETRRRNPHPVTRAFAKHFVPWTNVIYERAKFNSRKQEAHESVDAFVTELYRLAETCEYRDLKEKLIRDRLVVGLADTQLSEKLQLNAELTLEAAVTAARDSETIKLQQKDLRPQQQAPAAVDAMRGCSKSKGKPNQRSQKTQHDQTLPTCKWCGLTTHYVLGKRENMQCLRQKGTLCRRVLICLCEEEKEHPTKPVLEEVYLGQLTDQRDSGPWRTDVTVNGSPMKFKVRHRFRCYRYTYKSLQRTSHGQPEAGQESSWWDPAGPKSQQ
ncbi:hypothetical protein MRX96_028050 [Rhipicephalus microplus]